MGTRALSLIVGVTIVASVGCAKARLEVLRPLPEPERRIALRLEGAPESQVPEEQRSRYQSLLTSRLSEKGITVVAGQSDAHLAKGTIYKLNRGSRALRYLVGFGAGAGSLDSGFDVLDPKGEVIGACRIKGSVIMGIFGGNYDDVLEKSGDRLSEFLSGKPR
jgi:Domain of unknown function (DUF4410)